MLQVEGINKKFKRFSIKDVNFHLPKGYICGLIGENGAGKSTLIKLIIGLYQTDSGRILVDGMEFREHESEIKDMLGVILEECLFDKHLTLYQNACLYGPLYSAFDKEVFLGYLERFHLNPKQKLKKLSKGMLIKFQLAFALSHNAKLFIFDEPTAGLDLEFREEFLGICTNLIADGERSILISSHLTEDLDRIADYLAYMQKGELLFCKSRDEVCDRFVIVKAENYKLRLIPKEILVYMEEGEFGGSAMVVTGKRFSFDKDYYLERPDIQEIMYYLTKGGYENAKNIIQTYL